MAGAGPAETLAWASRRAANAQPPRWFAQRRHGKPPNEVEDPRAARRLLRIGGGLAPRRRRGSQHGARSAVPRKQWGAAGR
jgi:hypothetical protein